MLWNLLTAGIFGTDYYIKKKINTSEKKDLKEKCLGGRLIVRNCHNHGMMLGILKNKDKEFLRDLASMVLGGAIWEYIRTSGEKGTRISKLGLSMILGGGLNNYTERRRKGYVTDYVSLNVKKKEIRKIVFNLSDVCIASRYHSVGSRKFIFHIGKNNLRQKTKDTWHSALGVFLFFLESS